jgi:two-component system CheB/CheR fusion protein
MAGRVARPSVLVSPDDEGVYFSEGVGRYFVLREGVANTNVVELIREEFRVELEILLGQLRAQQVSRRGTPIKGESDGALRAVVLDLVLAPAPNEGFVLLLFEEGDVQASARTTASGDPREGVANRTNLESETELRLVRERLQHMVAAHRVDRQEMRGSMEELYSTNEELRSTMEELETSKEELQSMNEELRSLDQENRQRVDELGQLSSDLQNLIAATEIAVVFLDGELRILRVTPAMREVFGVRTTDEGRQLSHIVHRLGDADIVGSARKAIKTLSTVELEVRGVDGRWYLARATPYRSPSGRTEGAVLAMIDITVRKEGEDAQRQLAEERARLVSVEVGRQEERATKNSSRRRRRPCGVRTLPGACRRTHRRCGPSPAGHLRRSRARDGRARSIATTGRSFSVHGGRRLRPVSPCAPK